MKNIDRQIKKIAVKFLDPFLSRALFPVQVRVLAPVPVAQVRAVSVRVSGR
jgi:hypothetical protein